LGEEPLFCPRGNTRPYRPFHGSRRGCYNAPVAVKPEITMTDRVNIDLGTSALLIMDYQTLIVERYAKDKDAL
jgi:hypothetical protein